MKNFSIVLIKSARRFVEYFAMAVLIFILLSNTFDGIDFRIIYAIYSAAVLTSIKVLKAMVQLISWTRIINDLSEEDLTSLTLFEEEVQELEKIIDDLFEYYLEQAAELI